LDFDKFNIDKFFNLFPFASLLLFLVLAGVAVAGHFQQQHIKSLKDFIKYLTDKLLL